MRRSKLLILTALLAGSPLLAQTAPMTLQNTAADPHIWLEDKDGAKPLAWVEAENAVTLKRLETDPRYQTFYAEALAIAEAKDRIPMPDQRFGRIYNFWRDAEQPQGVWRWTTEADYANAMPKWTTALDLDALSKSDGKKWVWKGASCLQPEERLCLVALSQGGEDAVTYREFDLQTGQFVANGFTLPTSKQQVAWLDKDTLLVARDWGTGSLTRSGYPFVLKTVKRGQPLESATEVFRGADTDQLSTAVSVLTDAKGNRATVIRRGVTFFGFESHLLTARGPVKLDLPPRVQPAGLIDGLMLFSTSEAWGSVPAGAVASAPLAEVERGVLKPQVIFAPGPRQSVADASVTRNKLLLVISDEVKGRAFIYSHAGGRWTSKPLSLPDNATIGVASSTDRDDNAYVAVTSFIEPTTLYALDAATGAMKPAKQLPAKFDATGLIVEQHQATSSDGVKVPYFVVRRRDAPLDGSTPTQMTAYGGFEISRTPAYAGSTGKVWLERGGAYVLANIRGGGEFGPAWHDAGRKTKRQIIYDDFAAVARDLFARKITSPDKLGIYGGSNGGLLMGVEMVQQPELWKAVTIQVPLLDMVRYEQIAAGASWVDEYGSVSVPAERAFLERISPYQQLKRGAKYPEPYIWTTTKDDRVGPQHARKFAARMKEYGLPYLFYEDTAGGHSGDADIKQGARLQALQMVYFAQKLMGPAGAGTMAAK